MGEDVDGGGDIDGHPPRDEVKAIPADKLRAVLKLEGDKRTKAIKFLVYKENNWLINDLPPPEIRKQEAAKLLLGALYHFKEKERQALTDEIITIAGVLASPNVIASLLDPGDNRWYNINTGNERTRAALAILKNNPQFLKDPVATKRILEAAQKTCYDLSKHEYIARIAEIAAMTGDPGQRDHMIRHLNFGFALKESSEALGRLNYQNLESAMPAIAALNDLRERSHDGNVLKAAYVATDRILQPLPTVIYQQHIQFSQELNAVLAETGMGAWNRWQVRRLIANDNIRDTRELSSKLAEFVRSGRHTIKRERGEKGLLAIQKLVQK